MRKRCALCLMTLLVAVALGVGWDLSVGSPGPAFGDWVASHGIPLATVDPNADDADLAPLRGIVGGARVVCLGESRHDASEQFRLKHRMIRYLVEEMGFSIIVFEEGMVQARTVDDYILGGAGDPETILGGLSVWFAWDTDEILAFVEWMREYNADPSHETKIRVCGLDCTAPRPGLIEALDYIEGVDPGFAEQFDTGSLGLSLFTDGDWRVTFERYAAMSDARRAAIGQAYEDLADYMNARRSDFVRRSSPEEFDWAMRQVYVGQAAHDLYCSQSREEGGVIRDLAMADNLAWILDEELPGRKAVVWAHNAHVSRAPFTMPDAFDGTLVDMIYHLSDRLGDDLVSIAGTCHHGEYGTGSGIDQRTMAPTDTTYLGGALAQSGANLMLLDLRDVPQGSPASRWLGRERRMRGQGVDMVCVPADAYDAVYFVRTITQTHPGPRAAARMRFQQAGSR
jgi:erythromycin esterase